LKDASFEVKVLLNHWKYVHCDKNAAMTSRKWKGSNDSGRKYRSEWDLPFLWVQKAAHGSEFRLSGVSMQWRPWQNVNVRPF